MASPASSGAAATPQDPPTPSATAATAPPAPPSSPVDTVKVVVQCGELVTLASKSLTKLADTAIVVGQLVSAGVQWDLDLDLGEI